MDIRKIPLVNGPTCLRLYSAGGHTGHDELRIHFHHNHGDGLTVVSVNGRADHKCCQLAALGAYQLADEDVGSSLQKELVLTVVVGQTFGVAGEQRAARGGVEQ